MSQFKYRPDIDGLRAVAVILILIFHAELGLSGGFIGVDVFFVISGFLITGIILKDQNAGGFSLRAFLLRRMRRIFPAAAVVVIATLVAGAFLLWPDEYVELSESAVCQQLMGSNFYFSDRTGYFEGPSDSKPLLHTWSLAVEEQFYLIYPLLLLLLLKQSKRHVCLILGGLFTVSLVFSEYWVHDHPNSAFFLLPTRAWELTAGGLLWFVPAADKWKPWLLNALSVVGAGAIVGSACLYGSATTFPGATALLPCGGALLLIYSSTPRLTWLGRTLAARPMIGIGLISYSLYLWHWPIFAFLHVHYAEVSIGARLLALVVSFACGYCSWRWIEQPFRKREFCPSTRRLLIASVAAPAVILLCAGVILLSGGIPARVDPVALQYHNSVKSMAFIHATSSARLHAGSPPLFGAEGGPRKCLLWGDSHAMAVAPGLDKACKDLGIAGVQATYSCRAPLLNFDCESTNNNSRSSRQCNQSVADYAIENGFELVVLAAIWAWYDDEPEFEACLKQTAEYLTGAGIRVAIIRDVATHKQHIPQQLAQAVIHEKDVTKIGLPMRDHRKNNRRCDAAFRRLTSSSVRVVDPAPYLVIDDIWRAEIGGVSMYRDEQHLTEEGGLQLNPMFHALLSETGLGTGEVREVARRTPNSTR